MVINLFYGKLHQDQCCPGILVWKISQTLIKLFKFNLIKHKAFVEETIKKENDEEPPVAEVVAKDIAVIESAAEVAGKESDLINVDVGEVKDKIYAIYNTREVERYQQKLKWKQFSNFKTPVGK